MRELCIVYLCAYTILYPCVNCVRSTHVCRCIYMCKLCIKNVLFFSLCLISSPSLSLLLSLHLSLSPPPPFPALHPHPPLSFFYIICYVVNEVYNLLFFLCIQKRWQVHPNWTEALQRLWRPVQDERHLAKRHAAVLTHAAGLWTQPVLPPWRGPGQEPLLLRLLLFRSAVVPHFPSVMSSCKQKNSSKGK